MLRPADAVETAEAWELAVERRDGPTLLALTRQNLATIRSSADESLTARGAYLVAGNNERRDATLIAQAPRSRGPGGTRQAGRREHQGRGGFDTAPSMELFERQPEAWRSSVLGTALRIAIEAASPWGWTRYVASEADVVGMRGFGASAPIGDLYEQFEIASPGGRGAGHGPRRDRSGGLRRTGSASPWPSSPCASCSTTPPSTTTAWPPSTSTTWNRSRRSWRRPRNRLAGDHPGQPRRARPMPATDAAADDRGCRRAVPGHPDLHAPGPRQQPGHLHSAIQHGFTSVMMDGSLEGRRQDAGRLRLQRHGHRARSSSWPIAVGVSVEGELGCLGSLESGTARRKTATAPKASSRRDQLLTDPDQAEDFVAQTGSMRWPSPSAPATAPTSSPASPTGDILAMDRIEAIHERLPNCHLVMHGSSSVPQELQDVFNAHGGKMQETWGVPVEEIQRGIKHGVRKINVDTDCRIAMAGQFRKVAAERPAEFDPRNFLKPAMTALEDLCALRFEQFGAAGQASRIRPLPPSEWRAAIAAAPWIPGSASARWLPETQPSTPEHEACNGNDREEAADLALRRGRDEVSRDGVLGPRLRRQGHRRARPVPHHAAGRRRSDRGGRRRRRRIVAPPPGRWSGPTG